MEMVAVISDFWIELNERESVFMEAEVAIRGQSHNRQYLQYLKLQGRADTHIKKSVSTHIIEREDSEYGFTSHPKKLLHYSHIALQATGTMCVCIVSRMWGTFHNIPGCPLLRLRSCTETHREGSSLCQTELEGEAREYSRRVGKSEKSRKKLEIFYCGERYSQASPARPSDERIMKPHRGYKKNAQMSQLQDPCP
jgi:hypothetical protein